MHRRVVQFDILNRPSVIFNGVFDGSKRENEDQRNRIEAGIGDSKDGEHLRELVSQALIEVVRNWLW